MGAARTIEEFNDANRHQPDGGGGSSTGIAGISIIKIAELDPQGVDKKIVEKIDNRSSGEIKIKVDTKRIRRSTQFLSAIAANMGAFTLGTVMAWSATALPSLRSSGDLGLIHQSEGAWIGSIVTLAAVFSCPVAAYSMVTFGRRKSMLLLTLPLVIGWLSITFAESSMPIPGIHAIYFGRALTGFCGGAYSIIVPIFIAECSYEKLRGCLASGFDLMLSGGMLYVYIIGAYTSWQIQAFLCGIVPVVTHALLLAVSESPRFLIEQGKISEASNALSWLFGYKGDVLSREVSMLLKSVEDSQSKPINFNRVILKLSVLKPILISTAIMFFYTMCVYDAVIFYTVDIFNSTGASSSPSPKECAIILGVVQLISTIPSTILVDKYGRRVLLLLSEALLIISLASLGIFAHFSLPSWLPLFSLIIYLIGYSVGIGPLSLLLISELIPSHLKGAVTCFTLMIRWLLGFMVTNLFESLQDAIGIDKTWWLFATLCTIGLVFIYFCVPETKGKNLDDIQTGFVSAKNKELKFEGVGTKF